MVAEDAKSRLRRVVGDEGLARLEGATVAVFGIGGVGSSCAEALARGGIGHLVFIDGDEVQESNINRQALAFRSTVGQRKVDVMRAMVAEIYPETRVTTHDGFLLPENFDEVMASLPRPDYIVDAIDTVASKLALAEYAQAEGIALVSSMGAANKVDPASLAFADIYKTQNCPLCRSVRKQARARGIKRLTVLYSSEQPVAVSHEEGADRRERTNLGTMSYMPPIMGQMLAGYVIRELLA